MYRPYRCASEQFALHYTLNYVTLRLHNGAQWCTMVRNGARITSIARLKQESHQCSSSIDIVQVTSLCTALHVTFMTPQSVSETPNSEHEM